MKNENNKHMANLMEGIHDDNLLKRTISSNSTIQEYNQEAKVIKVLKEDVINTLNNLFENSSLSVLLIHNDKLLRVNDSFNSLLGYAHETEHHLNIFQIVHSEDQFKFSEELKRIYIGEINSLVIKQRYIRKDKSVLICNTNISVVSSDNGDIKYLVAILEDVTQEEERIKMLNTLHILSNSILGKTNLYELAWETARCVAAHLGLEDCVIYRVDSDKAELEQIAAYGVKNPSDFDIYNRLIIPIGEGIVGAVAKSGRAELINDTSKDSRYIIDDSIRLSELAVPIVVDQEVIGILDSEHPNKGYYKEEHLKVFTSVANLVAAQFKSAIHYQNKLESERQKDKLFKALQKSNEELNNFAHVVSHDLKSPLHSMNALVHWVKDSPENSLDVASIGYLELLLGKIEHMDSLIHGVLNYSRIDCDEEKENEVDLNKVVHELVEAIEIPKHIHLSTMELPVIKGDKFRLYQLFQNLLSNAVKFIDKPHGKIEISVITRANYFEFRIKDNGVGIPRKHHDRIFKMFSKLDTKNGGSGVGLTIVKKIVSYYEGDIWLDSVEGEGTSFYFTIRRN